MKPQCAVVGVHLTSSHSHHDAVMDHLSDLGFECRLAHDGDTAARLSLAICPSLVLVEAALPRKSGFQVCRIVRSLPAMAATRVVLFCEPCPEVALRWARQQGVDLTVPGRLHVDALRVHLEPEGLLLPRPRHLLPSTPRLADEPASSGELL